MLAASVKGLVGPAEYVHVELERGGDGAVGRGGGRARHHLVCLLHLVLIWVGYLGPVLPVVDRVVRRVASQDCDSLWPRVLVQGITKASEVFVI